MASVTSLWARASEGAPSGFPSPGLREGAPYRLRPLARLGWVNRAVVRAGRGSDRVFGLVAGVSSVLASASAVPSPKGLF